MNLSALLSLAHSVLSSAQGVLLTAALGWIVLDALLTSVLELRLHRFAPEAFSYFLEKIGGEYVGLVVLGVASAINAALLPLFLVGIGAFTLTESNGAYQKIRVFLDSLKKS
jgi:hypothetical protein